MALGDVLPAVNAALNGASAACLLGGWLAIRARRADVHWKFMTSAIAFSGLFLASYLLRVALTGTHRYPAADWTKGVYLFVLFSHMALAAVVPPLVARAVWLAVKKRYAEHRRLVRFTLPIWAYVSVTGVLVYWLLYHLGPARA